MTFLNPWFLFGSAACLVPLVIHLLNRNHVQRMDWAANRFLNQTLVEQRSQLQWKDLLLLALRILLPIALSIALAGPVLERFSGASSVSEITVVLDNSLSMQAHGQQAFALAKREAEKFGSQFPSARFRLATTTGDEVFGDLSAPSFQSEVAKVIVTDLPARPLNVLRRCAANQSPDTPNLLAIVSSFEGAAWQELLGSAAATNAAARSIPRQSPTQHAAMIRVNAANASSSPTQRVAGNVQVTFAERSAVRVLAGRSILLNATVENFSDRDLELQLQFQLDGIVRQTHAIVVEAASETNAEFAFETLAADTHEQVIASVELLSSGGQPWNDSLAKDDSDHLIIDVDPPAVAVLVDSSSSKRQTQEAAGSEAFLFALALNPFGGDDSNDPRSAFRVETVTTIEEGVTLARDNQCHRATHLMLFASSQPELDTPSLMRFVAQGGTLWVIPADDAVGHTETPGTPQIAESDWLPASSRIGRSIRTGLGNVHIQRRENWQVPAGDLPPIPLVADEQGRDIVSATPIGNGAVIVCQIGLSSRWSNLAVQPTALPLMHEIARFASQRNQWLSNVDVGKLSPRDLDQLRASKAASAGSNSVLGLDYERPASKFVGVYELAKPSEGASAENTIAAPLTAIRLAPGAGKLVPSDTSLYDRIADSLNADTVLADDGASKVRLTGYPLWTAVMLLFAIVLLAEGALANSRRAAATVTAKLGSKS